MGKYHYVECPATKETIAGILAVLDSQRNANVSSVIFLYTIGLFDNLSLFFSCFLSLVYKEDEGAASSQNCLAGRKAWFLFWVWYTHSLYTRKIFVAAPLSVLNILFHSTRNVKQNIIRQTILGSIRFTGSICAITERNWSTLLQC
jgi:hypothetical protein